MLAKKKKKKKKVESNVAKASDRKLLKNCITRLTISTKTNIIPTSFFN